jgi:FixJ family two-component response regulator
VQTVITDIDMPGSMNGLELAKLVHLRWPRVGIVVTSGRARLGLDDLADGAAFLAKPYRPETVIQMVQQISTLETDGHPSCARSSS